MDDDILAKLIVFTELAVFIVTASGIYFRLKAKQEQQGSKIKELEDELKELKERFSAKIDSIEDHLNTCKITEVRVKAIYKMLDEMSNRNEKYFDQFRENMIKIFDLINTKQDK
ncbi:MAG: hypothetical protein HRU26_15950 [Psychroserpens sp.]|nr:hypothetical protein [Psychroserpens sp.]